jgi:hypothetical protein
LRPLPRITTLAGRRSDRFSSGAGWITDIGTIAAIVTLIGVTGSLAWFWAVRWTFLRFLFERPEAFWLAPKKRLVLQPAE